MNTYVKENYNLSQERVTVFIKVCSDQNFTLKPEFLFKCKGKRTTLHPPIGVKYNWAPKGLFTANVLYHIESTKQIQHFHPEELRNLSFGWLKCAYDVWN